MCEKIDQKGASSLNNSSYPLKALSYVSIHFISNYYYTVLAHQKVLLTGVLGQKPLKTDLKKYLTHCLSLVLS